MDEGAVVFLCLFGFTAAALASIPGIPALNRRYGQRYRIDVLHPRVVVVDTHHYNATVCVHTLDLDDPTDALAKAHKDRDALEMAHRLARSGS